MPINRRLQTILDALPIAVLVAGKDGRVILTNRLAEKLPPDAVQAVGRSLDNALAAGDQSMETVDTTGPGGEPRQYVYMAAALRDRHGAIVGAVGSAGDITERQQKEREALHLAAHFETLLRHAPIGIALIDENLRYTALTETPTPFNNPRQVERGATIAQRVKGHHPPALADEIIDIHKNVLATGIPHKGTGCEIPRPDGSHYYIDWELRRVCVGEKILGLVGTAVDVTPHIEIRKELEALKNNLEQTVLTRTAELAQANATVATILESIADGFFATDDQWRIIYFNKTAVSLCGDERGLATGRCLWDLYPDSPTFQEPLRRVMDSRQPRHFETQELCEDTWFEVSASPGGNGGLVVSFRDITARKTTEQELLRLCSLDLVGQMAAGISHEVRNPLTTVKGFLQVLARKPAYTGDKDVIELMISEIDRATGIISQFLSVAKVTPGEAKMADLNAVIANLYPLLESICLEHGKIIVLCTDPGIPLLLLNEKEIRQLLLNLVNNALDAMQTQGRQITIGTKALSRRKVALYVKDEGCGIPADIIGKIGTPFMTTKDSGTGLGLATCYAIARRNNAAIEFTTSSRGTTFSVRFEIQR